MTIKTKTQSTHLVLKLQDVEEYLTLNEQQELGSFIAKIVEERQIDRKKLNEYLVINTDEPYAGKVYAVVLEGEAQKMEKRDN